MTLFHYTSTAHLPRILESGFIGTTESNFSAVAPNAGPPVVWLLDAEAGWPEEGTHGLSGSSVNKRAVRIEVDIPGIRWRDWAPAQESRWEYSRKLLVKAGGGDDLADHWYVFPAPIRTSRIVSIIIDDATHQMEELLKGEGWDY